MSTVVFGRIVHALSRDADARALALVVDRRAESRAARLINPDVIDRVQLESYLTLVQRLISAWWSLVAARFEITSAEPEFLPFDVTQFAIREEYRRNPGALAMLTIREPRLIVQLIDNMNLAAAHGLPLHESWRRVAGGLGISFEDDIIQSGYSITRRFRERCLRTGVLPFDLQVDAATWLLAQPQVIADLVAEYRVLAIDGLDEMVPALGTALCAIAGQTGNATIGYSTDGGVRWMLGASATHASAACAERISQAPDAFCHLRLRVDHRPEASRRDTADQLARIAANPLYRPTNRQSLAGWSLDVHARPDLMARAAIEQVEKLIWSGAAPGQIVLLSPYLDAVVASELSAGFGSRGIPFAVERRWRSLFDDPTTRACLTALRATLPGARRIAPVEAADALETLLGRNPIAVQPLVGRIFDSRLGRFRSREDVEQRSTRSAPPLPEPIARLLDWSTMVASDDLPLNLALEHLAGDVLSDADPALLAACDSLATVAQRFGDAAPRFGFDTSLNNFFAFIDSEVIAADDAVGPRSTGVTLTTPYSFLTAGRVADHQFWLDVASPFWWDPPLLILTNPHAIARGVPLDLADDERVRGELLGRIIRNLAARADIAIHAFASATGADGQRLDGPLLSALRDLGMAES